MNFAINRENNENGLKLSLMYLFPNLENTINDIINNCRYYDKIIIDNDKINTSAFYNGVNINEKTFIYDINILKICNEKTFIININSNKNYWNLLNILKKSYFLRYRNYYKEFDKKFIKLLVNGEYVYLISNYDYDTFFYNYKLIEDNQFIRIIKLKQIL